MKSILHKGKRGNTAIGVGIFLVMILAVGIMGFIAYQQGMFSKAPTQSGVGSTTTTISEIAQASSSGNIATIGVYVRDISNNNINTKIPVAVYCQDEAGNFIIDGTASSTTAEITGKTSQGKTITCYAFNSTVQTKVASVTDVDEEYEHILIDAYQIPTNGKGNFYNDQYATGTGGVINVTGAGADQSGTLQKFRFTQNNTDKIYPLGGFYFATPVGSNVSTMDLTGGAVLSGMNHASTQIVKSSLATSVSARKDNWDFVFEVDDDSSTEGNQALIMEENDYLETGVVSVKADGDGCAVGDQIQGYSFSKGDYRATKSDTVLYGAETDASTSTVITSDLTLDSIYCRA